MIRTKNKIYGEANDPNTVLVTSTANVGLVVGANNKQVKSLQLNSGLYIVRNGMIQTLQLLPNTAIGLNANGNIACIPKEDL